MDRRIWDGIKEYFENLDAEAAIENDCEALKNACGNAGRNLFAMIDAGLLDNNPIGIQVHPTFRQNPDHPQRQQPNYLYPERHAAYWICFLSSLDRQGTRRIRSGTLTSFGKPVRSDEHGRIVADWDSYEELRQTCPERFDFFPSDEEYAKVACEESIWLCQKLAAICEGQTASEHQPPVEPPKRKRATQAEMKQRNEAVAMVAAKIQIKYDRLPSVREVAEDTKFTPDQVYTTNAYKDGKIAKKSARATTELTGSSVHESEHTRRGTVQQSGLSRRSRSDQDQLDTLIDEQKKEASPHEFDRIDDDSGNAKPPE